MTRALLKGFTVGAALATNIGIAEAQTAPPEYSWGVGHMMFGGGIMMLTFWGGLALLVVLLVRGFGSSTGGQEGRAKPLDILQNRFARGEIDKQEYEERKKVLAP